MSKAAQIAELQLVVDTIFQSKLNNTDITQCTIRTNTGIHKGRWFGNGTLRGFDFTTQQGGKVVSLRVIEQNPNKVDKYQNLKQNAILARKGHKIAWIIRQDTNKFIGKIMDGKFEENKPRALSTAQFVDGGYKPQPITGENQYNHEHYGYTDESWISTIPEVAEEEVLNIIGL